MEENEREKYKNVKECLDKEKQAKETEKES